jgi:SAM-dependent methyltransferase
MITLKMSVQKIKQFAKDSGILPSYVARRRTAEIYLRGEGIEIGALDHPLPVPPQAKVRYVDYISKCDSAVKHSQLILDEIVDVDYIDDGFTLSTISSGSQDFVIANHVLEHSPDPIGALSSWSRVLKPDGILFFSVPISAKSFDRGRQITTIEHLAKDHNLSRTGQWDLFHTRNLEHYDEYLSISLVTIRKNLGYPELTPDEKAEMLQMFCDEQFTDTHYHVFSVDSLKKIVSYMTTEVDLTLSIVEFIKSKGGLEYIVVLRKV